ncbi:TolB family protein [Larkinella sp. VNQ87]|uniref:TolB family protein n=1 Tax=Larkinella sp. VNQ87 TaxID=3400921 RepID=UPI003C0260CB
MKRNLYPSAVLLLLVLAGCELTPRGYQYDEGTLPDKPLNLADVNSPDDDYNSDVPSFGEVTPLIFSSKRGGKSQFDFVNETLNYSFNRNNGKLTVDNKPYWGLDEVAKLNSLSSAVSLANSEGNELGPYIRSYDEELIRDGYQNHFGEYLMLFASDRTGNLDIYLTHNFNPEPTPATSRSVNKIFTTPVSVSALNSPADDAYPTFNKDYNEIYFTSNRNGSFDIYRASLPSIPATDLQNRLPELANVPIEKVPELSGTADDKCPYILGNILVFTSNRPGGLGGFDLYYSVFENGRWSAPVNFGPTINSSYDEYRPILREPGRFKQRLLLFSSNRPGGKGGFDLYMVGVPK